MERIETKFPQNVLEKWKRIARFFIGKSVFFELLIENRNIFLCLT